MNTSADDRAIPTGELQSQARVWLRLLTSADVKESDARGFQRWLQTSPAHMSAFSEVKRRWQVLDSASREFLRTHPDAAVSHGRALRGPRLGRRAFLGAAAGAVAAAGVAMVYPPLGLWPKPDEWNADYRTATGEQRTVALADHVNVTLNTRTSVRRQTADGRTIGIDLLAGEAAIDLASGSHSFDVIAGAGHSVADAGRFEVRYLRNKVCVTCIEGAVRVQHPSGLRALGAGQQAIYDADSISGVAGVDPGLVTAWRDGALVFNEVRLIDAIEEVNRYRPGRVVLMNSAVRNDLVSGRFLLASLDSALAQMQQMFNLHARLLPGGLYILS